MDKHRIDFELIKRTVSIEMVIKHYGIDWLHKSRDGLYGRCPIHMGTGKRPFHVSVSRNLFHCFSCGAKGTVLDFVAAIEHCDLREAALKLEYWFHVTDAQSVPVPNVCRKELQPASELTAINPVLPFRLKIDPNHPYGVKRGLTSQTIRQFGTGLCLSDGMFAGRYVIPLHDEHGNLVAYAGRSIDESEPKYLFPPSRRGFRKSHVLFNLHRVKSSSDRVVLVEGFFDCMKVSQVGHPCIAMLGCLLSKQQEELLRRHFSKVTLLFDGDEAGRRASHDCLRRLKKGMSAETIWLPHKKQPDAVEDEALRHLLER